MAGFWESCLLRFEQELPAQQFNTWIKPLRLEGESAPQDGLRLIAPNSFILKWVRDRYAGRIEEYAQAFFKAPISIALVIGASKTVVSNKTESSQVSGKTNTPAPAIQDPRNLVKNNPYEKSRLFPSMTFDNLIVGKANDLARAAAVQVANNPGGAYNPLFIYGGAGLGKTHLIHAIGNTIVAENPQKVVRYVHAGIITPTLCVPISKNLSIPSSVPIVRLMSFCSTTCNFSMARTVRRKNFSFCSTH
jgi:chromosomal replication initiator protein